MACVWEEGDEAGTEAVVSEKEELTGNFIRDVIPNVFFYFVPS